MTSKILIVDDDESIYENIIILFGQINEQTAKSYSYIPDDVKGFHKVRSKFNYLNSPINSPIESMRGRWLKIFNRFV